MTRIIRVKVKTCGDCLHFYDHYNGHKCYKTDEWINLNTLNSKCPLPELEEDEVERLKYEKEALAVLYDEKMTDIHKRTLKTIQNIMINLNSESKDFNNLWKKLSKKYNIEREET